MERCAKIGPDARQARDPANASVLLRYAGASGKRRKQQMGLSQGPASRVLVTP
jgi:hypothetical protein